MKLAWYLVSSFVVAVTMCCPAPARSDDATGSDAAAASAGGAEFDKLPGAIESSPAFDEGRREEQQVSDPRDEADGRDGVDDVIENGSVEGGDDDNVDDDNIDDGDANENAGGDDNANEDDNARPSEDGDHPTEPSGEGQPEAGSTDDVGDPEMAELDRADDEHERRSQELAERFLNTGDRDEKQSIRDELSATIGEHFEIRQRKREIQIERMEAEIQRLQEEVRRRKSRRDDIVARRVAELINEGDDLSF